MKALKVIAQGKAYIAIHKPSGLVTYADDPKQIAKSAKHLLERQLKKKLFPVHRIDKDTCGILVFAFSAEMARTLTALFRTRNVKKKYLAVVHGLPPERGTIEEPLARNKERVKEPALTDFQRIASAEREWDGEQRIYSLVRCEPRTGRFHQIRRHLRLIGHPIIGDPEYGNGWDNRAFRERFSLERTLLSAVHIAFPDRENERMVRLSTNPDSDFLAILSEFGWKI